MQRIFYANSSMLTGSDITRALLDYAAALARNNGSETITIPIRQADGEMTRATFLIGPASQLVAEEEESDYDEVRDDILVAKMKAMTSELTTPRAVSAESAGTTAGEVAVDTDEEPLDWL